MGDDSGLVERLRVGDEDALVQLIERHQPTLLRAAEATVGSRAVAEEVCQDTWLAVVRGIGGFEGRSSFRTWVFEILRNRARTSLARERRAGRPDTGLVERLGGSATWAPPPVPSADRVDDRLAAEAVARRVAELLPELSEQQRRVVVLHDVEGLANHDVALRLGVTDGHERVLLHRGRARLRALLEVPGASPRAPPGAARDRALGGRRGGPVIGAAGARHHGRG